VNLTLQDGREGMLDEVEPAPASIEMELDDGEEVVDLAGSEERDLDLTEESVREASLFDHESGELGEVAEPDLTTDDTGHHNRPRGGHARRTVRRRHAP
jgi:hypothetical protein